MEAVVKVLLEKETLEEAEGDKPEKLSSEYPVDHNQKIPDYTTKEEMYESFDRMIGDKSAVYISHRLASTRFCDKVAMFEDGNVIELGSHDELMKKGDEIHKFVEDDKKRADEEQAKRDQEGKDEANARQERFEKLKGKANKAKENPEANKPKKPANKIDLVGKMKAYKEKKQNETKEPEKTNETEKKNDNLKKIAQAGQPLPGQREKDKERAKEVGNTKGGKEDTRTPEERAKDNAKILKKNDSQKREEVKSKIKTGARNKQLKKAWELTHSNSDNVAKEVKADQETAKKASQIEKNADKAKKSKKASADMKEKAKVAKEKAGEAKKAVKDNYKEHFNREENRKTEEKKPLKDRVEDYKKKKEEEIKKGIVSTGKQKYHFGSLDGSVDPETGKKDGEALNPDKVKEILREQNRKKNNQTKTEEGKRKAGETRAQKNRAKKNEKEERDAKKASKATAEEAARLDSFIDDALENEDKDKD